MRPFLIGTLVGFLAVAITWSAIEFGQVVWTGEGLLRLIGLGVPFIGIAALLTFLHRTSLAQSSTTAGNFFPVLFGLVFGAGGYIIEVASFFTALALGREIGFGDWYWPVGFTISAVAFALILCGVLAAIVIRLLAHVVRPIPQ